MSLFKGLKLEPGVSLSLCLSTLPSPEHPGCTPGSTGREKHQLLPLTALGSLEVSELPHEQWTVLQTSCGGAARRDTEGRKKIWYVWIQKENK